MENLIDKMYNVIILAEFFQFNFQSESANLDPNFKLSVLVSQFSCQSAGHLLS